MCGEMRSASANDLPAGSASPDRANYLREGAPEQRQSLPRRSPPRPVRRRAVVALSTTHNP